MLELTAEEHEELSPLGAVANASGGRRLSCKVDSGPGLRQELQRGGAEVADFAPDDCALEAAL
jgi:hypothetical protein